MTSLVVHTPRIRVSARVAGCARRPSRVAPRRVTMATDKPVGGLKAATTWLLEAAWEIFNKPQVDESLNFTLQPYSGTPLSKKERREIDRMAGTVTRTAAAVRKEAAPPAEEDSSIVTASFGKFGEQSVPKTSPIGIITAAVQAVAGRLKDDSLPQDLFEGNLPALHYPEMSKADAKRLERYAELVTAEMVDDTTAPISVAKAKTRKAKAPTAKAKAPTAKAATTKKTTTKKRRRAATPKTAVPEPEAEEMTSLVDEPPAEYDEEKYRAIYARLEAAPVEADADDAALMERNRSIYEALLAENEELQALVEEAESKARLDA